MIRCWPVIHRAIRHRPVRRVLHHAVRHKAATITIVCVTVGAPGAWLLPPGGNYALPTTGVASYGENVQASGADYILTQAPETPVNVPEPSTLVLFATGLALLGLVRKKT
jgi:PEP-CTERM motif